MKTLWVVYTNSRHGDLIPKRINYYRNSRKEARELKKKLSSTFRDYEFTGPIKYYQGK